ncbi:MULTISPECIES: hypothetical protein [unclassified Streptomyces]|uniref:hypothetical protein n=1 Tax=unclassified Streptomyces TaxID=2593676 RepID=UPI0035D75910
MAAPQQDAPEQQGARSSRWVEPDPVEVEQEIVRLQEMPSGELAETLAAFINSPGDVDQVLAYAIRSSVLVRKARRLVDRMIREPEKYIGPPPAHLSNNAARDYVRLFRVRAENEAVLLETVFAGIVARRGHQLPEARPRSRARRRLADEHPQRFLELVREEEAADKERAALQAAERRKARAEGGPPAAR